MTESLIPNYYRFTSAQNFVNTFSFSGSNADSDYYYVFAGNHLDYVDSTITKIYDDAYDTTIDVYRNMIFGKMVTNSDVSLMIKRVIWQSGIVYAMYDDKDTTLSSKDFFICTKEGTYYHIYKCLSNNSGAASTVKPSFSEIGTDGLQFSPGDGYTWKYMYTVDETTFDKFSTTNFIPFVANTEVSSNAIAGSIDSIKITAIGNGYDNYVANGSFSTADVGIFSNSYYYGISVAGANPQNDFYKGCILTITAGTGSGQYRTIMSYTGGEESTARYVQLDDSFAIQPDNSSKYSIYPRVYITGDQTETVNAIAWAYINASGNSIARVEMLDAGSGYKIATANVYASEYVPVQSVATVRPILPPTGGHGFDQGNELYCSTVTVSAKFNDSEGNTVPSTNQFRQIGLVLNPKFNNATINYDTQRGAFSLGETVYNFYPKRVQNHVNIDSGNTTANAEYGGIFDSVLNTNTMVYISDGTNDSLFTVDTVTSNSEVVFNEESLVTFSNATMYLLDTQAYGTLSEKSTGSITLETITGHIKDDAITVGFNSGGYATDITSIVRNGETKQFDTFVQAYRYIGTITSGVFQNNELVEQTPSSAYLHSVQTLGGQTNFFVTNQNGIFNTSNTIVGETSGAVASLTTKYLPELVFGSGRILYLENLEPITRNESQTETFKLVFEF